MKLNATEKNALESVEYLLWQTKVKVTSRGIKEDLIMHPEFPSVASISDALTEWQVPNMATRLNSVQLQDIPLPSLVYLNLNGGMLAPLKTVTEHSVEWLDTQRGWQKEPMFDFEQKWNGITVLLEPSEKSGEIKYSEKSREQFVNKLRIPFLILGTVICLTSIVCLNWNQLLSFGHFFEIFLGLKLAGIVVGGLLLWQSLDGDNPFLQKICHLSNNSNCNGILQSKASKITSWLSWSEVGFLYFVGGLAAMFFALMWANYSVIKFLASLSLVALPYTIYSVWYQGFVAKKWCVLCILIQVILWAESAIVLIYFREYESVWDLRTFTILSLAFLMPVLIWTAVKKPLIESGQLFDVGRELQKVKFNEHYIKAAFSDQPKMPPIFKDMQTVAIGNLDAPDIVTVVTNPLCSPCSQTHNEINQFLEYNTNIRCQFVFTGPQKALEISSTFLNPTIKNKKVLMDSWYHDIQQNSDTWITSHDSKIQIDEQLRLHARWCEIAAVSETPTIYINGVKLPIAFRIRDLKVILSAVNRYHHSHITD
ncbi:vitamin K epoxide reductase family protein [Dyadobacter sp. CY347]|uniref:vitamin K epoxide reductase family protein n=1 Tax=Dyadobacter sp. CY347 TaxID=2909336 RepID=UPI001F46F5E4|nr:vitamin K epoxide reductase family protein [Dyadobacter sp. CY347]MCF2491509.1 peptidase C39 bacteriocin processing [Dyadobacter sp. CY347]